MRARPRQSALGAPVSQKNGLVKRQSAAVMFLRFQAKIVRHSVSPTSVLQASCAQGNAAYVSMLSAQHGKLPSHAVFQGSGLSHNYQPPISWHCQSSTWIAEPPLCEAAYQVAGWSRRSDSNSKRSARLHRWPNGHGATRVCALAKVANHTVGRGGKIDNSCLHCNLLFLFNLSYAN